MSFYQDDSFKPPLDKAEPPPQATVQYWALSHSEQDCKSGGLAGMCVRIFPHLGESGWVHARHLRNQQACILLLTQMELRAHIRLIPAHLETSPLPPPRQTTKVGELWDRAIEFYFSSI